MELGDDHTSAWFPLKEVRLRSEPCTEDNKGFIKEGFDIVVQAEHPQSEFRAGSKKPRVYYDAQVFQVLEGTEQSPKTTYLVQFYVTEDDSRRLATEVQSVEVDEDCIGMLQMPNVGVTLDSLIEAHNENPGSDYEWWEWATDAQWLSQTLLKP